MPDWRQLVRAEMPPLDLRPEREAEIIDELAQLLEDYAVDEGLDVSSEAELRAWIHSQVPEWQDLAQEICRVDHPITSRLTSQDVRPTAPGSRAYSSTSWPNPTDQGNRLRTLEQLPRVRWKGAPMERFLQNARYALRMIAKNPGFAVMAVITLGVGIGLNSAVFSVVNAVLLKPLPVSEPERLASVYSKVPDGVMSHEPMSFPDYEDLRDGNKSFIDLAAFALVPLALETEETSELVFGEAVTGNYFGTLGVPLAMGRSFAVEEDLPGGSNPVAVLSHSAWQGRFGGDPAIIGATIRLNGHPYTVIGVAPAEFLGLIKGMCPELWIPMRTAMALGVTSALSSSSATPGVDRFADRGRHWHWAVGRLRPGADFEQASAEAQALGAQLAAEYPDSNQERSFALVPTNRVRILPGVDAALYGASFVLMGIVALVLLIASGNIANMLLARAVFRRKEIATRLALGASRGAIVRQLLVESSVLSLLGGALGLALAVGSNLAVASFRLPLPIEFALDLSLDAHVFLFTLAVSTLTAMAFGLAPAFEATRTNLSEALLAESRGAAGALSKRRLRSALVVAQVALSMMLLICAGLSLRSMWNAHRIDPGFDPSSVVAARFTPTLQGYTPDQAEEFYRQLEGRVGAVAGMHSVAFADRVPLSFEINIEQAIGEDREGVPTDEWPSVDASAVGPGYFETMRIPLLRGRGFTERDDAGTTPVVVVNQTLAERFWPDDEAIGKRLRIEGTEGYYEVVGVARDGKYRTLGEEALPFLYRALTQKPAGSRMLLARTTGDPSAALAAVRTEARGLDERIAIAGLDTLEATISGSLLLPRMGAVVFGLFGLIGLLLATVGIYGVIAYSVSQRTREIGIRMAMGAESHNILRLVVRDGLRLTLAGTVLGVAGAAAGTRALSAVLYGISATDALTFIAVPVFLVLVALAASFIPAWRASRLDPVGALHRE